MKIRLALAAVCLVMLLSSCAHMSIYSMYKEPDDFILIQAIGIDWEDGQTVVTASTGTGLEGEAPQIFVAKNATLPGAVNDIKNGYFKQEAFFSHTSQIVVGEEAAKRGLGEFLDYAARNINMRLASNIYVIKGGKAGDLITQADVGNISATDMLTAIDEKAEFMLMGKVSTFESVIESLGSGGTALITAVEITPSMIVSEEKGKTGIAPAGYGLILDGILTEYISTDASSGAGIIKEEVKSGGIDVEDENGSIIALKIMGLKVKFKGTFNENLPDEILIDVKVKLNVEGTYGKADLTDVEERAEIERKAAVELERIITAAVGSGQSMKTDFCGIGDKLYIRYPYKFRYSYENWERLFPDIPIKAEVTAVIQRTYDIVNTPEMQGAKNENKSG